MCYRCEICNAVSNGQRLVHPVLRDTPLGPQVAREIPVCPDCNDALEVDTLSNVHKSRGVTVDRGTHVYVLNDPKPKMPGTVVGLVLAATANGKPEVAQREHDPKDLYALFIKHGASSHWEPRFLDMPLEAVLTVIYGKPYLKALHTALLRLDGRKRSKEVPVTAKEVLVGKEARKAALKQGSRR